MDEVKQSIFAEDEVRQKNNSTFLFQPAFRRMREGNVFTLSVHRRGCTPCGPSSSLGEGCPNKACIQGRGRYPYIVYRGTPSLPIPLTPSAPLPIGWLLHFRGNVEFQDISIRFPSLPQRTGFATGGTPLHVEGLSCFII